MENQDEERPPFNERAALEELERFKGDIERYRQQRKAVGEQFDDFVKSFKARPAAAPQAAAAERPGSAPASVAPASVVPAPVATAPVASARVEAPRVDPPRIEARPVERRSAAPAVVPAPPPAPTPAPPPAQTVAPTPRRAAMPAALGSRSARAPGKVAKKSGTSVVVLLALLLLAAGIAAWFFWPRIIGEPRTETATTPAPAPVTQPAGPATPAPQPAAPAVPADGTVLTTIRPVWLRIVADGKNVLERELPAGARFPFAAEKTVVIRTGDAGAVSLTLNGKDLGPLGREGQVVTRTFTVGQ
jgi:hypothetical protein